MSNFAKKILANLAIFKFFFWIFKGPLRHLLLLRNLKRCQKWIKTVEISSLAFLKKFWNFFQNESFSPFFCHFQFFFWIFKGPIGHTLLLRKLKRCQKYLKTIEISSLAFLRNSKFFFQNESFSYFFKKNNISAQSYAVRRNSKSIKKKFLTFWIFERFLPRHFKSNFMLKRLSYRSAKS